MKDFRDYNIATEGIDIQPVCDLVASICLTAFGKFKKKRTSGLNQNVIELTCIVDEEARHEATSFCKTIEYQVAILISSIIRTDTAMGDYDRNVFRSLPLLSRYDKVYYDKATKQLSTLDKFMASSLSDADSATRVFYESYIASIEEMYDTNETFAQEASSDVEIVDAGGVVGPTFIDIPVKDAGNVFINMMNALLGNFDKNDDKIRIGVRVTPKVVQREEFVQMFKKGVNALPTVNERALGFFGKTKRVFKAVANIFKNNKAVKAQMSNDENKCLYDMMTRVKAIEKPFVFFFMSKDTADLINDLVRIDVTKAGTLKAMFDRYPLLGLGILSPDNTIQATFDRTETLATYDLKDLRTYSKSSYAKIVENEARANM
jgi:hypothetical protein